MTWEKVRVCVFSAVCMSLIVAVTGNTLLIIILGNEEAPVYTFVSGFETLNVASRIILLHSHLLPQRLRSHPVDNAITDLQTQMHAHPGDLDMYACPRHLLFAAYSYLFCLLSEAVVHRLRVDTLPLSRNAAKHICSSIQHLVNTLCSPSEFDYGLIYCVFLPLTIFKSH